MPINLFLLFPPWPVSTPLVYKKLNYPVWDGKSNLRALTEVSAAIQSAWSTVRTNNFMELGLVNDLTKSAVQVEPRLIELQAVLEKLYPGRWLMSGSGSVHFVVREAADDAVNLMETLSRQIDVGIRVHPATTFTP